MCHVLAAGALGSVLECSLANLKLDQLTRDIWWVHTSVWGSSDCGVLVCMLYVYSHCRAGSVEGRALFVTSL